MEIYYKLAHTQSQALCLHEKEAEKQENDWVDG